MELAAKMPQERLDIDRTSPTSCDTIIRLPINIPAGAPFVSRDEGH